MARKLNSTLVGLPPSGIRKYFDLLSKLDKVISLGVGEPDFPTPDPIKEAGLRAIQAGKTAYTSNWGLPELRVKISEYLQKRFDSCVYDPEGEILITVGVSEAVDLVFRAITDPGDEIIMPEPSYVCYEPLIRMAGGTPVLYTTTMDTNFCIDPGDLERYITPKTKAVLINYPSNPTGTIYTRETLQALLDLARKHDFYILSDELYAELTYGGDHVSLTSLEGAKEYTFLMSGFSKSFAMTGWRVGYVCAPKNLMGDLVKIHQYNTLCAPTMSQWAAVEALSGDMSDVKRMHDEFERRCSFIYSEFVRLGFKVVKPRGAFYVFPCLDHLPINAEEFCEKLLFDHRVAAVPGTAFGKSFTHHIRCSYSTSYENLVEAMRRIEVFVSQFR